jgi:hypothetical protein
MLTLYPALISIFLGVNILPFSEKDGKELLVTSAKATWKFYLENVFLLVILMSIILLPGYILAVGMLYLNDAMASLSNLSIGYVLAIVFSIVCGLLAGLGSSFKYSKTQGYLLGGGYILFSFLIDLGKNIEGFDVLSDLSLHNHARIVEHSFSGTWNTEFILLCAILAVLIMIVTLFTLYRKDFLEGGVRSSKDTSDEESKVAVTSKLSFLKKPLDMLFRRIGWKYAALRDQLHSQVGFVTFFIIFGAFIPFYAIVMFLQGGEEQTLELLEGFQFPIFDAVMYNHTFDSAESMFSYFLAYEIFAFAWMIFGPFILIGVYNMLKRDKKGGYAEITWTLARSSPKIMFERTIAMVFSLVLIFAVSSIITLSMSTAIGADLDLLDGFVGFFALTWAYCVFLLIILSLALLFPQKHALKVLATSYFLSVILIIAGFLGNSQILVHLSPLGYFDSVGVFMGEIDFFTDFLPPALIGTAITLLLYTYTINKRLIRQDYQV